MPTNVLISSMVTSEIYFIHLCIYFEQQMLGFPFPFQASHIHSHHIVNIGEIEWNPSVLSFVFSQWMHKRARMIVNWNEINAARLREKCIPVYLICYWTKLEKIDRKLMVSLSNYSIPEQGELVHLSDIDIVNLMYLLLT